MMPTITKSITPCNLVKIGIREFASKSRKKGGLGGSKGSRGLGWLTKYREGRGGRHLQGRWFDRDIEEISKINDAVFKLGSKRAFIDFLIDEQGVSKNSETVEKDDFNTAKRIIIELADSALPKTVQNFVELLGDESIGYKGMNVARVEKKVGICVGAAGLRCHPSTSPTGVFGDEGFYLQHTPGLGMLSMMSPGVHKNDSRFVITTEDAPQLDGKFVAFGRVVEDDNGVLNDIQGIFTKKGVPQQDIKIIYCGVL